MITINKEQIRMMKHAIGFNASKVTRGTYVAYRNHYDCEDNADWNELVEHGFAKKRADPFCSTCVIYALTKEGKDFLSEILGVAIKDE